MTITSVDTSFIDIISVDADDIMDPKSVELKLLVGSGVVVRSVALADVGTGVVVWDVASVDVGTGVVGEDVVVFVSGMAVVIVAFVPLLQSGLTVVALITGDIVVVGVGSTVVVVELHSLGL